jgi:hypothetical protein
MTDVAGSGRAHTVNGPVRVSFRENPRAASSFKSINGQVELAFLPSLAADFRMKTFNGDAFSDFEYVWLPVTPVEAQRAGARFVYRSNRMTGLRVGSGGPEIRIETLNGQIRILKRGK